MNKYVFIGLFFSSWCRAATFERSIKEIQVYEDRVRIDVGATYGTCGDREGWWGWSKTNESSDQWLSLVLLAQAQGKKITVYDADNSCAGLSDAIGLEGVFLKSSA